MIRPLKQCYFYTLFNAYLSAMSLRFHGLSENWIETPHRIGGSVCVFCEGSAQPWPIMKACDAIGICWNKYQIENNSVLLIMVFGGGILVWPVYVYSFKLFRIFSTRWEANIDIRQICYRIFGAIIVSIMLTGMAIFTLIDRIASSYLIGIQLLAFIMGATLGAIIGGSDEFSRNRTNQRQL